MNRKLPPNLYQRQYVTRGGYKRTLYYPRIRCWDGKRRTFPGFEDFNAARAELARLLELNRRREPFEKKTAAQTGAGLFYWVNRFLEIKKNKKSIDRDRMSARYIKDFFGECELTEIVHSRLIEYRNARIVQDSTVNRELAFLRGVLYLAHRDGKLLKMPSIPFAEEHNERVRVASDAELKKILADVDRNIADVVILLRETGFRVNEVLKLGAGDLDPALKAIDMRRIRSKGGLKRDLPMSPAAWAILRRRSAGKVGPLFPGITRHQVHWHFERAAKAAGIHGLWVHDLRATFCTEKERDGWPRKIIMEFSGHRTEYAFRRYSRPSLEDLRSFIKGQRMGNTAKRRKLEKRVNA